MDIRFRIDPERLTLGDRILLEDPKAATWREWRAFLARFMTDENDTFLDVASAYKALNPLNTEQLNAAMEAFFQKVQELQTAQFPPVNGRPQS